MAPGKKTAGKAQKAKKSPPAARKAAPKKTAPPAKPAKASPKTAAKTSKKAPAKPAPKKAAPKPAPKKAAPKPTPKAPAGKPAPKPAPKPAAKAAPAPKATPKAPAAKPQPAPQPAPAPKKTPAPVAPTKAVAPAPAAPKKAATPAPAPTPAPAAPAPAPAAPAPSPKAAKAPAKSAAKKKPIPTTSLAATPVFRPLHDAAVQLAPPPPPAKPGHVDHQILSAITYGLFAAVNKTFGFAGQSVVKNASLRMLEYGYKRGWLPPKAKEPVKALNEFFGRLETMGYAEKIHIQKRGEGYVLEVVGLADFDSVHSLREMHYPLLPVFLGAMLEAIIDQYFSLKVTIEPIEFQEQKRGFNIPFSIHEKPTAPEVSRLPSYARVTDFEE